MFVDKVKITIKSGKGGDGAVSFRREKFIPKGGPDGGDGGDGGNVYVVSDHNMSTLMDFRSKANYQAENGEAGQGRKMYGKRGADLLLHVPEGTIVYEVDQTGDTQLVQDMTPVNTAPVMYMLAKGGKGGKGNDRFKSSTNQTPRQFTPGGLAEEKTIVLEIKLLADVGIIGLPNAGKSMLLNVLTNAHAKVANYPFTTLFPNLGLLKYDKQEILLADIPGLVEGASLGRGLGDDFLRHIERTKIILHVIDPSSNFSLESALLTEATLFAQTVKKAYATIRTELKNYSVALETKPELVVISKLDVPSVKASMPEIKKFFLAKKSKVVFVSAVTGEGIEALKKEIIFQLTSLPTEPKVFEKTEESSKIYTIDNLPNRRLIRK